jgi:hypothetical protein
MMRKCRQCGFPRKFARFFEWRPDGTILSTDRTGSRTQITFLDAGEFESIFDGLSRSIGHDVDSFLTRSYRDIGKTVYRNTSSRYLEKLPNNRFFRPQFLARLIIRRTAGDVAMLGDGRLRMDHFRAGESVVLRFKNPCVNQLLAGSAAAMYESVEGIHESVIEYDVDDGGDLVIRRHAPKVRRRVRPVKTGSTWTGPALSRDRCAMRGVSTAGLPCSLR